MVSVSGLTGVSRIAGFARDIMMAAILGAGVVADAFFVALKLPNLFRRITAEGAFSVAFVPLYSDALAKDGAKKADEIASNAFSFMLLAIGLFTLVSIAAMPWIISVIAPGFEWGGVRYQLAVDLSRITFPYLLFMSLAALLGGALNSHGRYAPFAAAPIIFNVSLIASLAFALLGDAQNAGYALAIGVFAAGILQFAFLAFCSKYAGIKITIKMPRFDAPTKKLLRLMIPGIIGAGVMQLNLFADMIIASTLQTGAVSWLYYADRLEQLPLGVIGIALSTALLPMLTKAISSGEAKKARDLFSKALSLCFLLGLPSAVGLFLLAHPIISTLFERGAFSANDAQITSQVLKAYVVGMPAYIAIKVFSSAFWARGDTTTPVKIAICAMALNICLSLSLIFIFDWSVVAIAFSTSVAGWVQLFVMAVVLHRKHKAHANLILLAKIALSSAAMGAVILLAKNFIAMPSDGFLQTCIWLGGFVVGGCAIYALCLLAIGARRNYSN